MNKYKTHLNNIEILKELECLGIHIQEPNPEKRTKKLKAGLILSINGEPCELISLQEVTGISELWEVHYFGESLNSFVYI